MPLLQSCMRYHLRLSTSSHIGTLPFSLCWAVPWLDSSCSYELATPRARHHSMDSKSFFNAPAQSSASHSYSNRKAIPLCPTPDVATAGVLLEIKASCSLYDHDKFYTTTAIVPTNPMENLAPLGPSRRIVFDRSDCKFSNNFNHIRWRRWIIVHYNSTDSTLS